MFSKEKIPERPIQIMNDELDQQINATEARILGISAELQGCSV